MLTWSFILLTVVMGSCGDVLCAKGMSSGGEVQGVKLSGIGRLIRSIVTRRLILLGFLCDAISFFSLLALFSVAQLSVAVPATALSFVIDTLGAHFFLHEKVHWKRWLGVLCVTAGVVLTVESSNGSKQFASPGVPAPNRRADHPLSIRKTGRIAPAEFLTKVPDPSAAQGCISSFDGAKAASLPRSGDSTRPLMAQV